jgi:flagellar protein FliS
MYARAIRSYQKVHLESASPARLLDELYERLLRDLAQAADAIRARAPAKKGELLGHALAIVGELRAALDHRPAPDLTAQLDALYNFMTARITRANVHWDGAALAEVAPLVVTLRDAFREAAVRT